MSNSELKCKAKAQLGGKLFSNAWLMALLVCVIVGAITTAAGTIVPALGATLILGAVEYGTSRLFLDQARSGKAMEIGALFSGFSSNFGELFLLGFLSTLFAALWALLFVIPGIIASYRYSFALYNLLNDPEMGVMEAMALSKKQTRGYKADLFVMDLSFIGWDILTSLTAGILLIYVKPFREQTWMGYYRAITGTGSAEGGDVPQQEDYHYPCIDDAK